MLTIRMIVCVAERESVCVCGCVCVYVLVWALNAVAFCEIGVWTCCGAGSMVFRSRRVDMLWSR
jgi:hypothetical protein